MMFRYVFLKRIIKIELNIFTFLLQVIIVCSIRWKINEGIIIYLFFLLCVSLLLFIIVKCCLLSNMRLHDKYCFVIFMDIFFIVLCWCNYNIIFLLFVYIFFTKLTFKTRKRIQNQTLMLKNLYIMWIVLIFMQICCPPIFSSN